MKKINIKIRKITILTMILMIIFMPISKAFSIDDILSQGDEFIEDGQETEYKTYIDTEDNGKVKYALDENGEKIPIERLDEKQLKSKVDQVYNIVLTVGIALSVLVGAILGIKYMLGSVEEQAKIKETLIPYTLGCFIIFGAFGIWKIIINIAQGIF